MTECLSDVARIQVWKLWPVGGRKSHQIEIVDPEAIETFRLAVEGARTSEFYEEDVESPRYFYRLFGSDATTRPLASGEVQHRHAFFVDHWLFMPRAELWNLFERLVH